MKKIVIAIDGHSSSGKSTMAKELAQEIGYVYIDTGAMYRAVTLYALRQGYIQGNSINEKALEADMPRLSITFQSNPGTGKSDTFLNGEDVEKEIRGMEVANKVSLVASIGFVRKAMVAQQQAMGKEKGIVMDGRDIGTVVFPHAELKLFVTASPEVRAQRRVDELLAKGEKVQLIGFGTFEVRARAAKQGRNPKTGEAMTIAASKVPAFKAGQALKNAVK